MRTRVEGARLLDFGEGPVPPVYCLQEQRSTSEKRYSCFGGVQGIINQARGIRGVPNLFHVLNCRHPSPLPAQQTDNWHPLTYTTSSGLHYWYPHHQTPLTTCIIQLYAFTAIVATMNIRKRARGLPASAPVHHVSRFVMVVGPVAVKLRGTEHWS